jgi:ribosome-binding protein aMBF1 (putative translation factor)
LGLLLGIAQRTVEAFYGGFKQRFSARKLIPTEVKTLGDLLLLKRIKADLSQPELGIKAGFAVRKIKAWEHDQAIPNEVEWQILAEVLGLDASMRPSEDNR